MRCSGRREDAVHPLLSPPAILAALPWRPAAWRHGRAAVGESWVWRSLCALAVERCRPHLRDGVYKNSCGAEDEGEVETRTQRWGSGRLQAASHGSHCRPCCVLRARPVNERRSGSQQAAAAAAAAAQFVSLRVLLCSALFWPAARRAGLVWPPASPRSHPIRPCPHLAVTGRALHALTRPLWLPHAAATFSLTLPLVTSPSARIELNAPGRLN